MLDLEIAEFPGRGHPAERYWFQIPSRNHLVAKAAIEFDRTNVAI